MPVESVYRSISLESKCVIGPDLQAQPTSYFLGCWMILGLLRLVFSWVGIGFSWKALTASLGKASSSPVAAPDTTTFFLASFSASTSADSSSPSSFAFSAGFSLSLVRGLVTTRIPPTFCAGAWPPLRSVTAVSLILAVVEALQQAPLKEG